MFTSAKHEALSAKTILHINHAGNWENRLFPELIFSQPSHSLSQTYGPEQESDMETLGCNMTYNS